MVPDADASDGSSSSLGLSARRVFQRAAEHTQERKAVFSG